MDRMPSFDELRPGGRVVFGSGRLLAAADEAGRLGGRIALIASASAARAADELVAALGASCVLRLDDVAPHVPVVAAREASERVAQARADVLVSIGGGAATGLAKSVAHVHGTPIVAVPTTYAGSEMTPVWGRTRGRRQGDRARPSGAAGLRCLRPRADAVRSRREVAARQRDERAGAGPGRAGRAGPVARRRLCSHSRRSANSPPPFPRSPTLPTISRPGSTRCTGRYLAGSALAVAPTGLHHRLAHLIGGRHGLSHAATHSALLPHVVRYLEERDPDRLAPRSEGCSDAPERSRAGTVRPRRARSARRPRWRRWGWTREALDAVAAEVDEALIPAGPLRALLADAHAGRRPEPLPSPRAPEPRPGTVRGRRGSAGSTDAEQATWRAWLDTYRLVLPTLDRQLRSRVRRVAHRLRGARRAVRGAAAPAADGARRRPHRRDPQRRSPARWTGSSGAAGCAARRRSTTSAASTRSSPSRAGRRSGRWRPVTCGRCATR